MNEIITQLSTFDVHGAFVLASVSDSVAMTIFLSVFFFGEAAILIALLLAQQEVLNLQFVVLIAIIGAVSADVFWFVVSRFFPQRFIPNIFRRIIARPVESAFRAVIRDQIFFSIFFLKFFVGIRLAIIVYLAQQPITFVRFFMYDSIGTVMYVGILTCIAFAFGHVINAAFSTLSMVTSVVSGLVLIFLISFSAKKLYLFFIERTARREQQ